jgi:hypothetical protein
VRLAGAELRGQLERMTADERLAALRPFTGADGRHTERSDNLREHIRNLNTADEQQSPDSAAAADVEPVS